MCLAVPMRLIEKKENIGRVEISGIEREVGLELVPEAKVGDYLLIHAGFAIGIIEEEEAQETLKIIREYLAFEGKDV